MNRIYISGRMRTDPNHREKFAAVATKLRALGYSVISPVEIDDIYGVPIDGLRGYYRRDAEALCQCDTVYMMKDWEKSKGAKMELASAEFLELGIIYE